MLEKGEINTYREKEHDLLMSIRNGAFLNEESQPTPAFYEMVNELENKLNALSRTSTLPESVDSAKVKRILRQVNEGVVLRAAERQFRAHEPEARSL